MEAITDPRKAFTSVIQRVTASWGTRIPKRDLTMWPDVRVGLHKGGAFIDWMIRRTENDGTWDWTVPGGLTPAFSYRLRLQSYTDKWIRTMSPAFTISTP